MLTLPPLVGFSEYKTKFIEIGFFFSFFGEGCRALLGCVYLSAYRIIEPELQP